MTNPRREALSWDEAYAYVDKVIERECAAQGLEVAITDPSQLALVRRFMKASRHSGSREGASSHG
jgi:hypothetical protein